MNIVHIVHSFAPEAHGGTQAYVESLARAQMARGHRVMVITGSSDQSRGCADETTDLQGLTVLRIYRDFATERLSGDLGSSRIEDSVVAHLRLFRADLCHIHHWHAIARNLAQTIRARSTADFRPRITITLHDLFITCPRHFRMPDARSFCDENVPLSTCADCVAPDIGAMPKDVVVAALGQRIDALQAELDAADVCLCVSGAQREFLDRWPLGKKRSYSVSSIGIPRALRDEVAKRPLHDLPIVFDFARPLRLTHWAGLDPRKGAHLLVEAVAGMKERARCEITLLGRAGEPSYMRELEEKGAGCRLYFPGEFEDSDRVRFGELFDAAVFPFLAFETHGLVVDEALFVGLPVLVSDRGAPKDRIGSRGITFKVGDVLALRRLIEKCLENPSILIRMREGAHGARCLEDHIDELGEEFVE